jgi:hypothetical protein
MEWVREGGERYLKRHPLLTVISVLTVELLGYL